MHNAIRAFSVEAHIQVQNSWKNLHFQKIV